MIPTTMDTAGVTGLLLAWRAGDERALHELTPLVYAELRRLASSYMRREHPGHTLQTTALVHEAYTRLIDTPHVNWQDRNHFFAICAKLMRRVLVDHARSHKYLKRGGGVKLVSLENAPEAGSKPVTDLFALDEALVRLAARDSRKSQVVEMHFFGGLTFREIADVLSVSEDTALRDWQFAKTWLLRELDPERTRGS